MNNRKLILIVAIILGFVIVLGCVSTSPAKETQFGSFRIVEEQIYNTEHTSANFIAVIHDDSRNVTCWTNWEMTHGGISCIPDSQLDQK